ncbi:MAG: PaaI family thioesterase [candidate division FCPU426 bacterium]
MKKRAALSAFSGGGAKRWGRLAETLKLKVLAVGKGKVSMRMPWSLQASQMAGLLHGGALTTLADTAAAVGTLALLPPGASTVTSELTINFISNITKGAALAEARLMHRGRLTMVWEVKVSEEKTGKLLALCMGTFFILGPKPGR